MYNIITKSCDCGHAEKVDLTDELKDEIDMEGYAAVFCSECGDSLDVSASDLENSSLYEKHEYGIYENSYDEESYDDDPDYNDRDDY